LAQNNHTFLFVITIDYEGKQITESIKSTSGDYASAIKELELRINHKVDHKEVRIVNVQKPRA
jgi:hypothetical protein